MYKNINYYSLYLNITSFSSWCSFFLIWRSNRWDHVVFSHQVSLISSNLWHFLSFSLFFLMILTLLKSTGLFENVLQFGFFWCFLMLILGFWIWGKYCRSEVPYLSHRVRGTCYHNDIMLLMLTLITWLKWRVLGLSTVNYFLFHTVC